MTQETKWPPTVSLLGIPSGSDLMAARLFVAEGAGPHPTVLVLHGFPGVQQNADIALELQDNGYNAMVFHYRGAWGSHGTFSFHHVLEDVQAVLAYLRQPDIAAAHRIDPERIALVGHSMGGFAACMTTAQDAGVKACASIAGFNFGERFERITGRHEAVAQEEANLHAATVFLNGASGKALLAEVQEEGKAWNLIHRAGQLADRPLLVIGGEFDAPAPVEEHHLPFVEALQKAGARALEHAVLPGDHNFSDRRKELVQMVRQWLGKHL